MARSWITGRRPLILAVVLLLLASQLPSAWAGWVAAVPRKVTRFVLIPGEGALRVASLALRPGTARRPAFPDEVEANYLELRAENQRLRNRIEALEDEVRQLGLVRGGLGDRPLRYLPARVTAHTATASRRTITLDHGRASGVEVGQAVVSGASLVGEVVSVTGRTSEVKLLNAPATTMLARIAPAEAGQPREIVEQLRVTDNGAAFVAEVARDAPVETGDLAHLVDRMSNWPAAASGRVVGVVVDINDNTEQPMSLKRVVVRPLLDFARLARVTVVMEADE